MFMVSVALQNTKNRTAHFAERPVRASAPPRLALPTETARQACLCAHTCTEAFTVGRHIQNARCVVRHNRVYVHAYAHS
jgi:hypothetical protein